MPKATGAAPVKPWLSNYPKDVPGEIGPLPFESLGDLLTDSIRKYASRPAFTSMDKTLTFAEAGKLSQDFGAFLQSKGLAKGARVALMMPNVLQYPIALIGALRAGYTIVNVNPLYTPRELEHQLKDSGAEAIVILENFARTLDQVVGKTNVKHVIVASMGDMLGGLKGMIVNLVVRRVKKMVPAWSLPGHVKFKEALRQGARATFKPVKAGPEDIAFLQYTGGTTGVSKGATLLHRNVLANVQQNDAWVVSAFVKKPRPDRLIYVCALPLYHIYALTVNLLMGMQQGAQNILIANPRDIPAFVKEMQKYPINVFPGLNTLFNAMLNNEDFRKLAFKPLLLTFGGGMAVQSAVAARWKELTGCVVSEGYGLAFNMGNLGDWGPGPMRDVLAGIDHLVADGLADPDRLGLTGGSYGGYLTNWILAHDRRFRAAITCRSVSDMTMLFLTGDISGGDWARAEFGATPWEDPELFRSISPITYADRIRTPLLIQHSERDIRTTVGQAEALFTVLRAKRRPVRLMRVPDETHELTRSGTPFRRVENLVQVRDWFLHFLVRGGRELPPLPRRRGGK